MCKLISIQFISVAGFEHTTEIRLLGSRNARARTNQKFGDRAFCVAAPRVWNRQPADLIQLRSTQTFRRHLKTFLFAASY